MRSTQYGLEGLLGRFEICLAERQRLIDNSISEWGSVKNGPTREILSESCQQTRSRYGQRAKVA